MLSSSFRFPNVCVCMRYGTFESVFSIGCLRVAKKPCVCMVKWGVGRERGSRSTEADACGAASDWTQLIACDK